MAGKRKQQEIKGSPVPENVAGMLAEALENGCDFILTFGDDDDGKPCMHVMTGPLITPCMLGTLSNRCEFLNPGSCQHIVVRRDSKGFGKRSGQSL